MINRILFEVGCWLDKIFPPEPIYCHRCGKQINGSVYIGIGNGKQDCFECWEKNKVKGG